MADIKKPGKDISFTVTLPEETVRRIDSLRGAEWPIPTRVVVMKKIIDKGLRALGK